MGFWNKLGQVALQAAPYVAAPFTGGASLSMAPMTGRLAGALQQHGRSDEDKAAGIGASPNAMNRMMGGVNQAAGAYGGGKIATNIGSGGGIFGRGGTQVGTPPYFPSNQGGGGGGLMDFARNAVGQQANQGGTRGIIGQVGQGVLNRIGNRGNGQPTSSGYGGAMNSPYANPQDYPQQNQGGGGFMDAMRGIGSRVFGGGNGQQGFGDVVGGRPPLAGNASQMGQQLGQTRGGQMGLGPRFDANNPDLSRAIMAGRRDSQMARQQFTPTYDPNNLPQFQPTMAPMPPQQRRVPQQESRGY